nr:hypothetical protein [Xanthomonadales bacterium]NIX12366.1 hypothetical protein [Xanthomonadales bacterium]
MKTRSIRRFRFLLVIGLLLLVVLGPVLTAQLRQEPGRRMTGVALSELEYSEVEFRNQAQGIDLAGLLFVPDGEGPHPAAVLIHGSGTSNRGNGWYSTLVHDLVESGIAVLLPDKRGSEASGGDWRTSSFEDLATDTVAAVDFLA